MNKTEAGATVVEYAMLVAAFAGGLVLIIAGFGEVMGDVLTAVMGGVETGD